MLHFRCLNSTVGNKLTTTTSSVDPIESRFTEIQISAALPFYADRRFSKTTAQKR